MALGDPYYHGIVKRTIIAMGELFSEIRIERRDANDVEQQLIRVPIAYGPKEKWLRRLEENPDLQKSVRITLPRMSFEITDYKYDSARRLNHVYTRSDTGKVWTPVPYDVGIDLHIMTRTQEDNLNLIEQILPYFAPNLEITINVIDDPLVTSTFPISLVGLETQDNYDESFDEQRYITSTLSFVAKINLYGPTNNNGGVITTAIANVGNLPNTTSTIETFTSVATPAPNNTYSIIDNWSID